MVDFVRSVAGIIQWGNVASWASAIASAAVFVAGVLVFKRDNRLRREDEEKLRKAERRQQAERITAWKTPDAGMQVDGAYQKLIVGLINDSTGVAYDVRIYVVCHRTEEVKRGDRLYKPEENEAGGHIPALPPGKWTVEIKLSTDRRGASRPSTSISGTRQRCSGGAMPWMVRCHIDLPRPPFSLCLSGNHYGCGLFPCRPTSSPAGLIFAALGRLRPKPESVDG